MNKYLCVFICFFIGVLIFLLIRSYSSCGIIEGYCCKAVTPGTCSNFNNVSINNIHKCFFPEGTTELKISKCTKTNGEPVNCIDTYSYKDYKDINNTSLSKENIKQNASPILNASKYSKNCKDHGDSMCNVEIGSQLNFPTTICAAEVKTCLPTDNDDTEHQTNMFYKNNYKECTTFDSKGDKSEEDCASHGYLNVYDCLPGDSPLATYLNELNCADIKDDEIFCNTHIKCKWDTNKKECTPNTVNCSWDNNDMCSTNNKTCKENYPNPEWGTGPSSSNCWKDGGGNHICQCPMPKFDPNKKYCLPKPNDKCDSSKDKKKCDLPSDVFDDLSKDMKEHRTCNYWGETFDNPYGFCCTGSAPYSNVTGKWNWIIGTCIGKDCGDPGNGILSYGPDIPDNWNISKDIGSKIKVNYVGAYQYDTEQEKWILQNDSSFNTNGSFSPIDLMDVSESYEKWWMPGPLPGRSANWKNGFYPAGAEGVGDPAMGFILSVEYISNVAWYILNQQALNRGPSNLIDDTGIDNFDNTWASGSSGEWDLLESPMFCDKNTKQCPHQDEDPDYRYLYSNTAINEGSSGGGLQHGRGRGAYHDQSGSDGAWFNSIKYFISDDPQKIKADKNYSNPRVFFAIMDKNGTTIFQIPTGEGKPTYWEGISRKACSNTLEKTFKKSYTPSVNIEQYNPGSNYDPIFKAVFMPGCPLRIDGKNNITKYDICKAGCNLGTPKDKGLCNNYLFDNMVNTGNTWGTVSAGDDVDWKLDMQTPYKDGPPWSSTDDLCTCEKMKNVWESDPKKLDSMCGKDSPWMCTDGDEMGACKKNKSECGSSNSCNMTYGFFNNIT